LILLGVDALFPAFDLLNGKTASFAVDLFSHADFPHLIKRIYEIGEAVIAVAKQKQRKIKGGALREKSFVGYRRFYNKRVGRRWHFGACRRLIRQTGFEYPRIQALLVKKALRAFLLF